MKYLLYIVSVFFATTSSSQHNKKTYNIKIMKGDIVNNKTVYYYIYKSQEIFLSLKRLNTTKPVTISMGYGNMDVEDRKGLEFGVHSMIQWDGTDFFLLKLVKNKLILNVDLPGFDILKVAEVQNNRVIPGNYFDIKSTDSTIEIFDKYNIPIFQMYISQEYNQIFFAGVFHSRNSYQMFSPIAAYKIQPFADKLTMSDQDWRATLAKYLNDAKTMLFPFPRKLIVKRTQMPPPVGF